MSSQVSQPAAARCQGWGDNGCTAGGTEERGRASHRNRAADRSDGGLLMTHFLTVRDVRRPRAFYADLLGRRVVIEENPCILRLADSGVIMNRGGGPRPTGRTLSACPTRHRAGSRAS